MDVKVILPKLKRFALFLLPVSTIITVVILVIFLATSANLNKKVNDFRSQSLDLSSQLASVSAELATLKADDQYVKNKNLQATISAIELTYQKAVTSYENLLDFKSQSTKTSTLDDLFSQTLAQLSKRDYQAAETSLKELDTKIADERQKLAATVTIPENVPVSNSPPGSGYSRQKVTTDVGEFMVSIVSADLNSTRVIVDTASDGTCASNCPVLPLADYVARSGAFAGVNGSYFCPASYPSCAGKENSFDTLLMNKNKVYFNSDNNVYSIVPAVTFSGNSARFVGQSLELGRDTGIDAVLANQPLLVSGGNVVFGGDGDPKKGSKGGRSFVGATGSTVYIGVVHSATVAESARVLKALGLQYALNLDDGGSTALWYGGYKAGPGKAPPNVLLFVRK